MTSSSNSDEDYDDSDSDVPKKKKTKKSDREQVRVEKVMFYYSIGNSGFDQIFLDHLIGPPGLPNRIFWPPN